MIISKIEAISVPRSTNIVRAVNPVSGVLNSKITVSVNKAGLESPVTTNTYHMHDIAVRGVSGAKRLTPKLTNASPNY